MTKRLLFFSGAKFGEGPSKNENLSPWTKLNQILYTLSVGSQKTKNEKKTRFSFCDPPSRLNDYK